MNLARLLLVVVCPCLALPALAEAPPWPPGFADGKPRQFSRDLPLSDALEQRWVGEILTYTLDFPAEQATLNSIRLYDWTNGKELPFQLSGVVFHDENRQFVKSGVLALLVDEAPAGGARSYSTVYWGPGEFAPALQPAPPAALKETDLKAETFEVTNGLFSVRLAGEKRFDPPVETATVPGPLRGFKGPDGVWRATSRFVTDANLLGWKGELVEEGPFWKLYRVRFEFDSDRFYDLELKMLPDRPYAFVTERNNFRLRLAELPHPLSTPVGDMDHGKCQTRPGVADQLRILMKENFDPDICYTPETYSSSFAQDPLKHDAVKVWTAIRPVFPFLDGPWLGAYSTDEKKNDLVAIVGRDAAHWEYPDSSIDPQHLTPGVHAEIHFVDEPGEHAYYRIPVARAVRHWLLAVGDKRDWTQLRYPGHWRAGRTQTGKCPYLAHVRATVCDLPLDKVKEWHLDWEQKLPGEPRLFFSPAQAEALRKRIEGHEPSQPFVPQVKGEGLATGQGGAKTVSWDRIDNTGEPWITVLQHFGYAGNVQSSSIARPMRNCAEALDYNARTLDLGAAGRGRPLAQVRQDMAFLASVLTDGDYWPHGWNLRSNAASDLYIAVSLIALVLPDHPNSNQWLECALGKVEAK